jgi:anti-sigma regulatory factor (Ser/Thr protein kinase)
MFNFLRPVLKRRISLRNDIQQIPLLSAFVDEISGKAGLDAELTARINLVLEEAVSNVIKHGYEPDAEGSVDIEAKVGKDSLEFTLTDTGVPFDPTEAPMPDTNLGVEERPIGGLGVYLIRTIMDSVSYRREGGRNILTLTKRI